MNYNLIEKEDRVILEGLSDFEPVHIFECGQCFRWNREEDGSYTGVAYGKLLNVKREGDDVVFSNTDKSEFESVWKDYFDIERDYGDIKSRVSLDDVMAKSVEFGSGIRILKQEPWEMLISFIISARNSIPNIKKTIEKLSVAFGELVGEYNGVEYYSFPTPDSLCGLSEGDIRQYGTSFRTRYIMESAERISSGVGIDGLKESTTESAREKLMEFPGVGPKVSDCILLFGLSKYDVFPVDIWVQRVMDEYYLGGKYKNLNKIREYGLGLFGEYAGFGQQYLFYYARENGVGKK